MKKKIRINFVDFWPGFDPQNNYFHNILSKYYEIDICAKPDFLFFSCYSQNHLKYDCTKIQFLAENVRPDFSVADYALTFDFIDDDRHLRLPLYVLYFDQKYTIDSLLKPKSDADIQAVLNKKKKFCCFLVSNPNAPERIRFFHELSKYKKIDSGGRLLNNIGHLVSNKLEFVSEYKFIIAFENSSYPGYTTEKVLEPKQVDTIPIYWGNPVVNHEMNTSAFVNYHDVDSFDILINRIVEIDQDEEKYINHLREPLFRNHEPNKYFDELRLMDFLTRIFETPKDIHNIDVVLKQLPKHSVGFKFYLSNLFKKL